MTMFMIVWKFVVREEHLADFIEHYAPHGTWAELFRRDPAYIRTELQREGRTFVTRDYWRSEEAYHAFRAAHAAEYEALDRKTAAFTEFEAEVMSAELPGSAHE
jgi:heme-degrading monooxygenase HmoA